MSMISYTFDQDRCNFYVTEDYSWQKTIVLWLVLLSDIFNTKNGIYRNKLAINSFWLVNR